MKRVISKIDTKIIMMHSFSVPPDKTQTLSPDEDPIDQLIQWAQTRMKELDEAGIEKNRIIFDPGLGFGKTPSQSWEILNRSHEFKQLKVPTLIGHSRKSFFECL